MSAPFIPGRMDELNRSRRSSRAVPTQDTGWSLDERLYSPKFESMFGKEAPRMGEWKLPRKVIKEPLPAVRSTYAPPAEGAYSHIGDLSGINVLPRKSYRELYEPLAGAPKTTGVTPMEEQYSPWLNPAGHILSAAGALADYGALRKARPTPASFGRMGAERISLAKQRLANIRNAEAARSSASAQARSLGLNAGQAYSNIAAATTGVNRLLGQQNAELLEKEEATNAQLRQQAAAINAELTAQESLFNAQRMDAYRAMLARANPMGALARTAAQYFADTSAYGLDYDTLKMLAPNAEVYKKGLFKRPGIRFKTKT